MIQVKGDLRTWGESSRLLKWWPYDVGFEKIQNLSIENFGSSGGFFKSEGNEFGDNFRVDYGWKAKDCGNFGSLTETKELGWGLL